MHIKELKNNINFQSGLNNNLIKQSKNVKVKKIEANFLYNQVDTNFKDCQSIAFTADKVFQIFDNLSRKLKINTFQISIPRIQIYQKKNLIFDFQGYGFCIPETQQILKKEFPFETGSIFFEKENSLEEINQKLDESFKKEERSSSHYLAPFIHEFLHNSYINYIYTKYGYEGICPYTSKKYHNDKNCGHSIMRELQTLKFNEHENKIIRENLGQYATTSQNQYHEVFAETFTKLICNCLSAENSTLCSNPIDELKKLPKEFLTIVKKLFL